MAVFRHILFPVDFSERCASVRPFVKALAKRFGAEVTLLHVFEAPPEWCAGADSTPAMKLDVAQMEDESCSLLREFFPVDAADNLIVHYAAACGDPAKAIVAYAANHDVDLVMLPTHGVSKFRALLLGSVASEVVEHAPCAVWTTSHTEDPALPEHVACRTVLARIANGSGEGRAREIAEALSADLIVGQGKDADLIVTIGTPRATVLDLVRDAACPVLSLR